MSKQSVLQAPDDRGQHGAMRLPRVTIDSYNLTLKEPDSDGFVGDRASQTAFRELLDTQRRQHLTGEKDPFGDQPTKQIDKNEIDLVLVGGDADAAHLVHAAVEDHAQRLAGVVQRFLDEPQWRGVRRIVVGGGFIESKAGALSIRRAACLLKLAGVNVSLHCLKHDADDCGLLGWVHLAPQRLLEPHDAFLAVDIGGTKIRCGMVKHARAHAHEHEHGKDGAKPRVIERHDWRHAGEQPARGEAVRRMAGMLNGLIAQARTTGLRLAPFVGIACPGEMQPDGSIAQGGQNLPGNWEAKGFNLPRAIARQLDPIGKKEAVITMHNDAVVQGLSELSRMRGVRRWGVLTIGTGLGNASYSNTR